MGQGVLWVCLEARAPLSLWDQPGGASCPWERRCSKPWASSVLAISASGSVPIHGFKAILVFLFGYIYGNELIFTSQELKCWGRSKNFRFCKIIFQAFQKPLLLFQLLVVPVSLKWPQGADTAWIFWDVLSGKLLRGIFIWNTVL